MYFLLYKCVNKFFVEVGFKYKFFVGQIQRIQNRPICHIDIKAGESI